MDGIGRLLLIWSGLGIKSMVGNVGMYVCSCSRNDCYIRIVYGCLVKMISWGLLRVWVVRDWRLTGVGAGDRAARLSLANTYELMTRTWRQGGLFLRGRAGLVCFGWSGALLQGYCLRDILDIA